MGGELGDLGGLLASAQEAISAQAEAARATVEGSAGGGVVTVTMTGTGEVTEVTLAPEVVDPDDVEMLQDLIVAALHDAGLKVTEMQREAMGALGGLDLGSLGDMFGGLAGGAGSDETSAVGDRVAVYAGPVQDLIDELGRLPGVGPKSAQRIAFHLLKVDAPDALRLARAIAEVKEKVSFCRTCFNVAEGELCGICADGRRDTTVVCVVEEPRDLVAVEKTGEFSGRYHVLQGAISPIEGVGPDQLRVRELLDRIGREGIAEVILCTNPNLEGEATAMYLGRLLKPLGL